MSSPKTQIHSQQSNGSFEETCEEIDAFLLSRYPPTSIDDPSSPSFLPPDSSDEKSFRVYDSPTTPTRVITFYKEQHEKQTVSSVIEKRKKFASLDSAKMSVWDALELLDTLID